MECHEEYVDSLEEYICGVVEERLKKVLRTCPQLKKGIPAWVNVLFLLDQVGDLRFSGILTTRIVNGVCFPFRIAEEQPQIEEKYKKVFNALEKLKLGERKLADYGR